MQALWMVFASFFFATMGVGVKFASAQFNVYEIVFYRGLIGIVFMALVMRQRRISVMTTVPWMHVWRSVIGVFSLLCWFYAIANLPLATAMTLNYMSGVWVAAFVVGSAVFYSFGDASKSQGALVMTVLCGFAGVVLTLRPTIEQNQLFAGVLGLLSGIAAALAYMQVAMLARAGEPEERTVLYFGVGSAIAGAIGMAIYGVSEHGSLANDCSMVAVAHWDICHPGAMGHDTCLQQGRHLGRRKFAIFRYCVCQHLQHHIVRRCYFANRLVGNCGDCHEWPGRNGIARTRCSAIEAGR